MIRIHLVLFSIIILAGCCPGGVVPYASAPQGGVVLNDIHSRLNATRVEEVFNPETTDDVIQIIQRAKQEGKAVSISGGRHAMGGQQFGENTLHISTTNLNDVLSFDRERGIVRVEAGITWPTLIDYLNKEQEGQWPQWTIIQKQSGADKLTLGGALSANAHSRAVKLKPMINDVESFTLVNADGELLTVSRSENPELFKLVIGGYGLFGVIATVDLRLQHRTKLQRIVEVIPISELPAKTKQKIEEGYLYGDFQYKTDEKADDFMKVGVLSAYKPVPLETPVPEDQIRLPADQWNQLIHLAHTRKDKAFEIYSQHYLKTDGQIYWSDAHQMSYYNEEYIEFLKKLIPDYDGSLMITEVYVPRDQLNRFIDKIARDARRQKINIVYGTMRLIERDDESFLVWAKQNYACVIFNLYVDHTPRGLKKAERDFQVIIERALQFDGSFYLTYHRWARKDQVLRAYPQFPEFLRMKLKYDPQERFQSEWYRHYKKMFL